MITPNVVCICGVLVELVDHDLRELARAQLEHDADALAARLVAPLGDALDPACRGSARRSSRCSEALFTWYGSSVTMMASRPPRIFSTWAFARSVMMPRPGRVRLADARRGRRCTRGREVRARDHASSARSIVASGVSISITRPSTTSDRLWGGMFVAMPTAMPEEPLTRRFGTLVGRTIGSCSDSSKFGDEVDRVLVDVGEQLVGDARQPRLGVAHGRRRVAVDRAEVPLPVHQRVAQRELLHHADERLVHRRVAVRDGTCRAPRRPRAPTSCTAG